MKKIVFALLSVFATYSCCEKPPECPKVERSQIVKKVVVQEDPAPGGFKGIPWRTCSDDDPSVCSLAKFRTTELGKLTDGSALNTKYIFTSIESCLGNYCRADLVNGHQCQNGDQVSCKLVDTNVSGTSTCAAGAWGSCK